MEFLLSPDAEVRKALPLTANVPNLGYSSYQLRRVHQSWDRYNFGWIPPNNPIDRNGFGCAFTQASFPWVGVTELERPIQNLSVIMATTFNASEYQQTQIDSLLNSPTKPQSPKLLHCKTGRNLCPP